MKNFYNELILEISFYFNQMGSFLELRDSQQTVNMVKKKINFRDHIALIFKYEDGEIVFFEVTESEGATLCRWKFFLKHEWNLLYNK